MYELVLVQYLNLSTEKTPARHTKNALKNRAATALFIDGCKQRETYY